MDFETGLAAVDEFNGLVPDGVSTAQAALAWVVAQEGVTTVIPGARTPAQARANAEAASEATLGNEISAGVLDIYDRYFREAVHPRW